MLFPQAVDGTSFPLAAAASISFQQKTECSGWVSLKKSNFSYMFGFIIPPFSPTEFLLPPLSFAAVGRISPGHHSVLLRTSRKVQEIPITMIKRLFCEVGMRVSLEKKIKALGLIRQKREDILMGCFDR